jgi:VIT1/CCC1 family predicted Fe2+/Mn2+ transporter
LAKDRGVTESISESEGIFEDSTEGSRENPPEDHAENPAPGSSESPVGPHDDEPHGNGINTRLNALRAGVLGANDGIVSTAGLVVGVAGATTSSREILVAGIAGLFAGALSMATGEYVSVSTQRDSEQALLAKERRELEETPDEELAELADLYMKKGLSERLAREVAIELTEYDALGAHAEAELGIDPNELTSPWHAAWASMIAFTIGALIPLLTMAAFAGSAAVPVTVAAVVFSLALTGGVSARLGYSPLTPAIIRNIGGGMLAMGVTFLIGTLVGTQLG